MSASKAHRPKPTRRLQSGMEFARDLMLEVCRIAGDSSYLRRTRSGFMRTGIAAAVQSHDTLALFNWFVEVVSYQGVSDAVAWRYMESYGRIEWGDVEAALCNRPSCPRLASYSALKGCRYSKATGTCAEPEHRPACPLPHHDLRKGTLNRTAYTKSR